MKATTASVKPPSWYSAGRRVRTPGYLLPVKVLLTLCGHLSSIHDMVALGLTNKHYYDQLSIADLKAPDHAMRKKVLARYHNNINRSTNVEGYLLPLELIHKICKYFYSVYDMGALGMMNKYYFHQLLHDIKSLHNHRAYQLLCHFIYCNIRSGWSQTQQKLVCYIESRLNSRTFHGKQRVYGAKDVDIIQSLMDSERPQISEHKIYQAYELHSLFKKIHQHDIQAEDQYSLHIVDGDEMIIQQKEQRSYYDEQLRLNVFFQFQDTYRPEHHSQSILPLHLYVLQSREQRWSYQVTWYYREYERWDDIDTGIRIYYSQQYRHPDEKKHPFVWCHNSLNQQSFTDPFWKSFSLPEAHNTIKYHWDQTGVLRCYEEMRGNYFSGATWLLKSWDGSGTLLFSMTQSQKERVPQEDAIKYYKKAAPSVEISRRLIQPYHYKHTYYAQGCKINRITTCSHPSELDNQPVSIFRIPDVDDSAPEIHIPLPCEPDLVEEVKFTDETYHPNARMKCRAEWINGRLLYRERYDIKGELIYRYKYDMSGNRIKQQRHQHSPLKIS